MKTQAIAIASTALVVLTGCSAATSSTSEFSSIVKVEVGNFIEGEDLLECNVSYAIGGDDCTTEIKQMVFASQRIINKFTELKPNDEVRQLVLETISALDSVANSGFETACTPQNEIKPGGYEQCRDARIRIAGGQRFYLQDVWSSLDSWQPYF